MDGYNKTPKVDSHEETIKELEKQIQKNLDGMVNEYYDQLDFFKDLKLSEADKEKIIAEANRRVRRKRVMRTAVVAAILVCVCSSLLYFTLEPGTADRENIQNRLEHEENNGRVSGTFGDPIDPATHYTTYDKEEITQYKKQFSQMLTPVNIPNEWEFSYLQVDVGSEMFFATYRYECNQEEVLVRQREDFRIVDAFAIYNVTDQFDTSFGSVYVQKDYIGGYSAVTVCYKEDCELSISGKIEMMDEMGMDNILLILEAMVATQD